MQKIVKIKPKFPSYNLNRKLEALKLTYTDLIKPLRLKAQCPVFKYCKDFKKKKFRFSYFKPFNLNDIQTMMTSYSKEK